ncbi:carbonic anhydrase [Nitrosomonas sp. ANs5]|uniref:carbonic anhydrase n=1 Tax=Nitrosomonas sp. ANs5 TaxID=3423941 RepID=UPI003D351A19
MKKHHCAHRSENLPPSGKQRRKLLHLATLGAGVSLFTVPTGARQAHASGKAKTLLLSCMDYRLMDEIERYMLRKGLYHNYDHIVLAGASLGAITEKYPAWTRTFWDHLDLSVTLHGIHTVIVMDHRDCGAYKMLLGEDYSSDLDKETAVHTANLMHLKKMINEKYPQIEVETLLMDLKGEVEVIQDTSIKQEAPQAGEMDSDSN